MSGGKETPRQKMIGMMYLVLTALLAMNVSKDILEAFVIINEGIAKTNKNFIHKNEMTYHMFDVAKANDPIKVTPYWNKSRQVKDWANDAYDHIGRVKWAVILGTNKVSIPDLFTKLAEDKLSSSPEDTVWQNFQKRVETAVEKYNSGKDSAFFVKYLDMALESVDSKDNYDEPSRLMGLSDPATPTNFESGGVDLSALHLKGIINEYRENLYSMLTPEDLKHVDIGLRTPDFGEKNGTYETWETGHFYHVPLAATVTQLSKMQSDIRNAEADIIKELYSEIDASSFKFDTLAAKVIANTNYVFVGDTYRAEVLVAAFSTTQNPILEAGTELDSGGYALNVDTSAVRYKRGTATYSVIPRSEGLQEWGGVIKIKDPTGKYKPFKFLSSFMVAKPTTVVSPTAMNVFYRGLDNPVEVSAGGVAPEDLRVSMTNGSISGKNGKYTVRPGTGQKAEVMVKAEVNGEMKSMGKMEFRVKAVPDPKPYFASVTGSGNLPKTKLMASRGVIAQMENFEFDLRFNIVSFNMSATVKGKVVDLETRGPAVSSDMQVLMKNLPSKSKLYIEKIKAKGPDGTIRDLGTIVLTII